MKKKICFFSAQYLPHLGGVENYTYNLSKYLILLGYDVMVVTSNTEDLISHEILEGIDIYRFPAFDFINGRYPVMKKNSEFKEIESLIKKKRIDFIIVNTRFYIHSLYGVKFAKNKNIPCIVIEHGTAHLTVQNKLLDSIGAIYEHLLTNRVKKYCKDYYAVSTSSREWLTHFNIEAKGLIHNSIDDLNIEKYLENPIRSFRKDYNILPNSTIVAFTGRLVKEKGILALLEAFEKITRENSSIYLFIAGNGPLYDEILNKKYKNVFLAGKISFAEVISLLKESDIFCLPSDSEGFSTSILEAGVCNNYIISTNTGGIEEILLNEDYGLIIEDNEPDSIQYALEFTLSSKERIEYGRKLTKINILNNFTWKKTAKKVSMIIEEILMKNVKE